MRSAQGIHLMAFSVRLLYRGRNKHPYHSAAPYYSYTVRQCTPEALFYLLMPLCYGASGFVGRGLYIKPLWSANLNS